MTAAPSEPATAAAQELICCPPDLQIHALGEGQLVVHNRLSGSALVLDTDAQRLLSMCREPSPLSRANSPPLNSASRIIARQASPAAAQYPGMRAQ